jgi:hypothetical protein
MKYYLISVNDGIVTLGEQVIASDNRGIKGGILPPHVLDYAMKYARNMGEPGQLYLSIELYVMPLVDSVKVVPGKKTRKLLVQIQDHNAPAYGSEQ